jgi:uncharacterized Zn finger protein
MSWGYYGFRPYVPVAQRRAKAARELAKLAKKTGAAACPVVVQGRKIASTFWGEAWCNNLEAYSDFANRLPRGRTYVRNGSVVDLQIAPGKVSARVSGSQLYRIDIGIKPLPERTWKSIQRECSGKIDSLLELLQGKLSSAVMQVVTRQDGGLFPSPAEIEMECSCPDWAGLCKHLAACLYGIGARLDTDPALLFLLRGVNASDLISQASAAQAVTQLPGEAPALDATEIADVFGIELDHGPVSSTAGGARSLPAAEPSMPASADSPAGPALKPVRAPRRPAKSKAKAKLVRKLKPAARARRRGPKG